MSETLKTGFLVAHIETRGVIILVSIRNVPGTSGADDCMNLQTGPYGVKHIFYWLGESQVLNLVF